MSRAPVLPPIGTRRGNNKAGRPTVKGAKKKSKAPGKRASYAYAYKYEVVVFYNKNKMAATLAEFFPRRKGTTLETPSTTYFAAHPKYKSYRNYRRPKAVLVPDQCD